MAADAEEILLSWGPGESRLALIAEGRLVELVLDRPDLLAGSVFLGRVGEVNARLDAAFVDLGRGDKPGFLPGAAALGLSQGQSLLVQVRADAQGGKGPLLTAEPRGLRDDDRALIEHRSDSLRAPALVWRPHPLVRLLHANPSVTRVRVDDAAAFAEARALLPDRVEWHRDGSVFTLYDVDEAIDAALDPVVPLPGGGRLVIEPTSALTAIDVDSGAGSPAEANRRAVDEIARQMRLRAIGGQIVVDFVSGGGKGSLFKLAGALKRAVAFDPVPTHVFGVTPLGLVELTRERRGPSLAEQMSERPWQPSAATMAFTALRRVLAEVAGRPGLLPGLVVAPEVADALARLPEAMAEAGRRLGVRLAVRAESGRRREDISIEDLRP
jgi:Ribonuclease G/E